MNIDTKTQNLPNLIAGLLGKDGVNIDNLFADLWKSMGMAALLNRAGFHKRSGLDASQVVFLLLIWVWLKVDTINMFSRQSMQCFTDSRKDVMYDFLQREDINWRVFHAHVAQKVVSSHKLNDSEVKAFVVDDSVKIRTGKKMEGVSRHFDHLTGKTVMGQQTLTLGYAGEDFFLPLDSDIYISQKQVQPLIQEFADGRSVAARRHHDSLNLGKPALLAAMLKRAVSKGFAADYLLADAWFGNKTTLRLAQENDLTAILRMKKGNMQYRYSYYAKGRTHTVMADAVGLFRRHVRKQWQTIPGTRYQCKVLDIELNLAESPKDEPVWVSFRLLFVRGTAGGSEKAQAGKHDWALFLSADTSLSPARILEIYAVRWSIEVYFKEAKRHLGLLKEQTLHFASHIASIHLTAIRFCMLVFAKLESPGLQASAVRNQIVDGLLNLSFAKRLWVLFKALLNHGLTGIENQLGCPVDFAMSAIEETINNFFMQTLQLDAFTMRLEAVDNDG
jgi:hypothetical protein